MKQDGFDYEFDPKKCDECGGKCCTGESGYIWIDESEIKILGEYLGYKPELIKEIFLEKFDNRYSIKEKPYQKGWACIFFDEKNKNCSIYEYRPKQCRSFPFWEHFKTNYKELEMECIGVKQS
ncbi:MULTISPECIES: YkgJ family cysteine cluster protein [Campylobacter]|uniref:YkgJ family cysteine cluster protein n=1 Tax=Campylobacter vicugnae TaxID=1660076 RepID=A0ABZ2EA75_9BACT|nr:MULTISPECIES: YkgJ family cysteine cluster protein [unclassified Campylobacter]MCR8689344.1 YkgJ family cysteine cluster protein [Campylobacter sp. RM9264]MCR8701067.1 YkgJ family cysteine cluster protein [Campylobacter sp. RM12176]